MTAELMPGLPTGETVEKPFWLIHVYEVELGYRAGPGDRAFCGHVKTTPAGHWSEPNEMCLVCMEIDKARPL